MIKPREDALWPLITQNTLLKILLLGYCFALTMESKIKVSRFERNPKTTISIILVVAILIMDLIGTATFQFVSARFFPAPDSFGESFRQSSEIYDHDLKPMANVQKAAWGPWTYQMYTNSLGFRDRENRIISLESKNHRILLLGDSLTEGIGVNFENSYAGLLQRQLEPRGIEVLNAAVVAYSPLTYYQKLKYLLETKGLKVNEIVVFLATASASIETEFEFDAKGEVVKASVGPNAIREEQLGHREFNVPSNLQGVVQFIREHSILVRSVSRGLKRIYLGKVADFDLNRGTTLWTVKHDLYEKYGKKGMENCGRNMTRLMELARKHGLPVTIGVLPQPDQVYYEDLNSIWVQYWRQWASQNGADFIDFFASFIGKGDKFEILENAFIHKDTHYSAGGHKIVADAFLAHFNRKL